TLLHTDATPTPISATGTPNTIAAPVRSLYQTDTIAMRLILPAAWTWRTAGAVAWIQNTTWEPMDDFADDDRPFDNAYVLEQLAADRAETERQMAEHERLVADYRARQSCRPAPPEPQRREKVTRSAHTSRSLTMVSNEWAAWITSVIKAEVPKEIVRSLG